MGQGCGKGDQGGELARVSCLGLFTFPAETVINTVTESYIIITCDRTEALSQTQKWRVQKQSASALRCHDARSSLRGRVEEQSPQTQAGLSLML
jgi:hypothetical protein